MNNSTDEIQQLREQMAAMKKSLDDYGIVNKQLIQTVMKGRTHGLNMFVNAELITVPFLCLFFFVLCNALNITMWLPTFTSVMMIVSAAFDLKTMRVSKSLINRLSLQDLRKYLVRQKRYRKLQLAIESPLIVVWIVWFMMSYLENDVMFGELKKSGSYALVEAIVIGAVMVISAIAIGVTYHLSQRVNDSMISDIDSIEEPAE